jgi:hypothetical protein
MQGLGDAKLNSRLPGAWPMAQLINLNIPNPILPIETLPDRQILAICTIQLDDHQQDNWHDLLDRENELLPTEVPKLQFLLKLYRRGLVRKAKAPYRWDNRCH